MIPTSYSRCILHFVLLSRVRLFPWACLDGSDNLEGVDVVALLK